MIELFTPIYTHRVHFYGYDLPNKMDMKHMPDMDCMGIYKYIHM